RQYAYRFLSLRPISFFIQGYQLDIVNACIEKSMCRRGFRGSAIVIKRPPTLYRIGRAIYKFNRKRVFRINYLCSKSSSRFWQQTLVVSDCFLLFRARRDPYYKGECYTPMFYSHNRYILKL